MSENGDGFDHLRIPFDKIKFGEKLEVQGYGTVFEGEFDYQQVALKQLNITNLANIKPKLLAEILTISRFREHPNVVALLGFCDERSNEIILVYEYVASGNLADKMRKRLNTIQRFEICLGAARGLDYLHTGVDSISLVHGHIKPSKILLNSDTNSGKFEAKVSSFGLSKIFPGQKNIESTDDETKATKESDVYSFGVMLLEVLCGVSELVDTDDYQERHVSELVPKRLEQNKLRKIVHFDIRKEIKTESLETYAKIACQCVLEKPEARPTMGQVVEELEKSLRLQGGEVSYVQIPTSKNMASEPDEIVIDDGPNDDGSGVIDGDKLDVAGEDNGEETSIVGTTSEFTNGEKNTEEDTTTKEEPSSHVPFSNSIDGESVPDITPGDAQNESSINDPQTAEELIHGSLSNDESNVILGNEDDEQNKTHIQDAQNQIITTNDPSTTEEFIDNSNSNKIPSIARKNEDDDQITKPDTFSESSKGDTSTSQEVQNSGILKSGSRDFNNLLYENHDNEIGDGLEHLRIPYEKITFGKKIDERGYGSIFEGEFDDQHVALKRLNITNLGNIRPKLLAEILTIARFRKHPNLVALMGFCDEKSNEIILVYEYVSSGNLADKMSKHLTTIQRLEICLDAARGLDYLHSGIVSTPGIIHGNIKLSKIMLNSDSTSSKFKAKVSGFGLSKLLPGHVQIAPKSMDPMYEVTGKLMKELDVYSFGVLLLEVLCGVPELVDTDDYHERHVTELIPKRLEQNMLRKVVHFDIRDEITTESLETYARIACRCVIRNPEERPTMAEVVIELEKALRLQGGEVSYVQILGSTNSNSLPEGIAEEDVQEGDEHGEKLSMDKAEEEPEVMGETIDDVAMQGESFPVQILGSVDGESVPDITKDTKKENDQSTNDPDSTEEITIDLTSNEESKIIVENEVDNESKIISSSDSNNGDDDNSAMQGQSAAEKIDEEDATKDNGYALKMSMDDPESNEIMDDNITETRIAMEVQNPAILDSGNENAGKHNALLETEKKPELIVNIRGDTSDFSVNDKLISVEKNQEFVSKRSNSTCSESSNGDDTTPSDYLLQKSPANGTTMKKTSNGSTNCCCWWGYIFDRVVLYGGQFWNKMVSCFNRIIGHCSSKSD